MTAVYPPIPDWVSQPAAEYFGHEEKLTQGSAVYAYTCSIPGLVQEPGLIKLTCQTALRDRSDELVAEAVQLRTERQVVLGRKGVHFEFLIDEVAFWRRYAAQLMQAQLERLIREAARPNVTIRIVSGFYPGVCYDYQLVHVHDGSLHLYREDVSGGRFESNTGLAVDYLGMFGRAWQSALSPDASVTLIRSYLAEL
jgi:hypothetical protein